MVGANFGARSAIIWLLWCWLGSIIRPWRACHLMVWIWTNWIPPGAFRPSKWFKNPTHAIDWQLWPSQSRCHHLHRMQISCPHRMWSVWLKTKLLPMNITLLLWNSLECLKIQRKQGIKVKWQKPSCSNLKVISWPEVTRSQSNDSTISYQRNILKPYVHVLWTCLKTQELCFCAGKSEILKLPPTVAWNYLIPRKSACHGLQYTLVVIITLRVEKVSMIIRP